MSSDGPPPTCCSSDGPPPTCCSSDGPPPTCCSSDGPPTCCSCDGPRMSVDPQIKMAEFKTPVTKRIISVLKKENMGTPQILIPPSPCMRQLGYGTGVNVYLLERFSPMRGCYKSPWAVKKRNSKVVDKDGEFTKRLSFEAEVLKRLNHPNIIGYRSYTYNKEGTRCLAMESGDESLADIIETRQDDGLGPFPCLQILKVARDISSALIYLHDEMHLLHGDLKSANILIKNNFDTVKLCDFGVTLKLNENGVASEDECYVGTECWSAPEVIACDAITHKTDMFSFGLVLWEMLSLNPPHMDKLDFSEATSEEKTDTSDGGKDEEFYKALGTRPALPDVVLGDDYLPVLEIFYACTEADHARRPSAKQVLHVLDCLK
nr:lymphokine-activated killer T-cell-originated protein kinase-like [Procambarus clarkii]